jgi:hypothetical protein
MGNSPQDIYQPSVGDELKVAYGCSNGAASKATTEWSKGMVSEIITRYNKGFCGFKMKVDESSHINLNNESTAEIKIESMSPESGLEVKLYNSKWHRLTLLPGNVKIKKIISRVKDN